MTITEAAVNVWVDACEIDDLVPERGGCVLIGPYQVALFRLHDSGRDDVFALSNYDPFSDAYVISRGVVGSKGDALKVASPVFKHNFDLRTGVCLDDPTVSIPTFAVTVVDGRVLVAGS